jgi:hypothetical protein
LISDVWGDDVDYTTEPGVVGKVNAEEIRRELGVYSSTSVDEFDDIDF